MTVLGVSGSGVWPRMYGRAPLFFCVVPGVAPAGCRGDGRTGATQHATRGNPVKRANP
jgi:hypothetical protein